MDNLIRPKGSTIIAGIMIGAAQAQSSTPKSTRLPSITPWDMDRGHASLIICTGSLVTQVSCACKESDLRA